MMKNRHTKPVMYRAVGNVGMKKTDAVAATGANTKEMTVASAPL